MSDTLETLAARLRTIEDREAIRELIARYGPLADNGDAEGVAGLWAEDGDYAVVGFAAASGRKAIADLMECEEHQRLLSDGCAHLLGPVAIELNGDRATARGHSVVFRSHGQGFVVHRVSANRWTLVRGAEGWQVAGRTNAMLDGNDAARALLAIGAEA